MRYCFLNLTPFGGHQNRFNILGTTSYSILNILERHFAKFHTLFTKWAIGPLNSTKISLLSVLILVTLRNWRFEIQDTSKSQLKKEKGEKLISQSFPDTLSVNIAFSFSSLNLVPLSRCFSKIEASPLIYIWGTLFSHGSTFALAETK